MMQAKHHAFLNVSRQKLQTNWWSDISDRSMQHLLLVEFCPYADFSVVDAHAALRCFHSRNCKLKGLRFGKLSSLHRCAEQVLPGIVCVPCHILVYHQDPL